MYFNEFYNMDKYYVFIRNFYILLIDYMPLIADILTVIFTLSCNCFRK